MSNAMPPPPPRRRQVAAPFFGSVQDAYAGHDEFGRRVRWQAALPPLSSRESGSASCSSRRGRLPWSPPASTPSAAAAPAPAPAPAPPSSAASAASGTSLSLPSTNVCPTSAITFHESDHGRLRREQRRIAVRDLQAAMKYGTRRRQRNGRSTYTHEGITYVVDDATRREVTSFERPLDLPYRQITDGHRKLHRAAVDGIRGDRQLWRSNSVLLVDTSGSMRGSDVRGSRTRLSAVWAALAQDFVAHRLESGTAGHYDVVTVVLMGETATVLFQDQPTDWILYNRLLRLYKGEERVRAAGHGCYGPALDLAETLLRRNDSSSCALLFGLLSDGRPSDAGINRQSVETCRTSLVKRVGDLASVFGRRLTVANVGMGSASEFSTLSDMADAAKDHGSLGVLQLPSMTCSSLGAAMSSIATSLTQTQTELMVGGDGRAGRQRRVRMVTRESKKLIPLLTEVVDEEEFHIYMGDNKVERMWFDPDSKAFKKVPLQHPNARGVAIKKKAFGEGTERLAHQFFEVEGDGESVVGAPLVAKESRFVEESEDLTEFSWWDRDKFVKRFCSIQHQAKNAARAFNEKLDGITRLDPDTARVSFLDCSVYYLTDDKKGQYAVIVERRLDGKFTKWNSNNGWHSGKPHKKRNLVAIEEDKREEDIGDFNTPICLDGTDQIFVSHDEVAQAFSHFSYTHSGKKMLCCDLQGVYDRHSRMLRFTDPVIHYHDVHKQDKRGLYGRTDRGRKGMHDFFRSHVCNSLCTLVTRGFKTSHQSKRQRVT